MIFSLFRRDPRRAVMATLYAQVAEAARAPGLYAALGTPDTIEGRFESLCLHAMLLLRALRSKPGEAAEVSRDFADALFRDLDAVLREMGVGDTRVPKRMKTLAEAFYGRAQAYDGPLDRGDEAALALVLGRNVQGGDAPAPGLARYALAADRSLREQDLSAILEGGPRYPAPEAFAG